jgi:hypothetical protein
MIQHSLSLISATTTRVSTLELSKEQPEHSTVITPTWRRLDGWIVDGEHGLIHGEAALAGTLLNVAVSWNSYSIPRSDPSHLGAFHATRSIPLRLTSRQRAIASLMLAKASSFV